MIYGHIMHREKVKPRIWKRIDGLWICGLFGVIPSEIPFGFGEGSTAKEAYQDWLKGRS